jgi:hypothetical protein
MKEKDNDHGLKRFREINNYTVTLYEQAAPASAEDIPPPPEEDPLADPAAGGEQPLPGGGQDLPDELPGAPEATEDPLEAQPSTEDDTTEEVDITDLVNMIKDVKKEIDEPKEDPLEDQKMNDVFAKLDELEAKLGDMDNVLAKIDQLGVQIEKSKPPTPVEKLEMRSLDSYPFNTKPNDFFNEKKVEMEKSGKNEYVLTKQDVDNYGKYDIMKSFNPQARD